MPLNNIPLPANCYFIFDILIQIVSFDFFPLHEYFDFSFTHTEPWSNSFAWLDYDSLNFIENMGSASLVLAALLLNLLIALVVWCIENKCGKKMPCRGAAGKKKPKTLTPDASADEEDFVKNDSNKADLEDSIHHLVDGQGSITQPQVKSNDSSRQHIPVEELQKLKSM